MHILTLGIIAFIQDSFHSVVTAGVSLSKSFPEILYSLALHASICGIIVISNYITTMHTLNLLNLDGLFYE